MPLAAAGAHVDAIDFSEGMLAQARAKPGADRVRFRKHDLAAPLPFEDARFDLVLSALVLDHIHDVPGFFREARRVTAPGGSIVVTVMHPAMMLKGVQARFTDLASGRRVYPRSAPNQISDYVRGVLAAGLGIDHISEHPGDDALVRAVPKADRYLGWPMLLALRLVRPEDQSSPSSSPIR